MVDPSVKRLGLINLLLKSVESYNSGGGLGLHRFKHGYLFYRLLNAAATPTSGGIVATKVHYIMYKQVVAREREISAMTSTLLRQQRWRLGERSSSIVGRYSLRVGRSCSVRRRGYHFGIPGRSHQLSG